MKDSKRRTRSPKDKAEKRRQFEIEYARSKIIQSILWSDIIMSLERLEKIPGGFPIAMRMREILVAKMEPIIHELEEELISIKVAKIRQEEKEKIRSQTTMEGNDEYL